MQLSASSSLVSSLLVQVKRRGKSINMDVLVLDTCCFRGSVTLRTGSIVIAYILLVGVVIMATILAAGTVFIETTKAALDKNQQSLVPDIQPTEAIMLGLLILLLPFVLGLLMGLHRNQQVYVKAFLMADFLFIVLDAAMFFMSFLYDYSIPVATFRTVIILVEIYFFVVIRSYYYKMR